MAVVFMAMTSEPALGSVMAKQLMNSAETAWDVFFLLLLVP